MLKIILFKRTYCPNSFVEKKGEKILGRKQGIDMPPPFQQFGTRPDQVHTVGSICKVS